MSDINAEKIEKTINNVAIQHQIRLNEGDIQAFRKAYLRFGDIDLALNIEGDVISDVMEGSQLDIIAEALNQEFGPQSHAYPSQIYTVKINGNPYKTYIDEYGEQRFLGCKILSHLLSPTAYEDEKKLYHDGQYTTEEWLEFNAAIGAVLKEFMRSLQTCLEIENPREMR